MFDLTVFVLISSLLIMNNAYCFFFFFNCGSKQILFIVMYVVAECYNLSMPCLPLVMLCYEIYILFFCLSKFTETIWVIKLPTFPIFPSTEPSKL